MMLDRERRSPVTRWRLFLGVGLLAVIGAGVVVGWWAAATPAGVNRISYLRIGQGMRHEQVEAILGGPPGNYRTDGIDRIFMEGGLHRIGYRRQFWYGDDGDALIEFDSDKRVASREWRPRHATSRDRMVRRLGLDW
jgi:hypothetical protein